MCPLGYTSTFLLPLATVVSSAAAAFSPGILAAHQTLRLVGRLCVKNPNRQLFAPPPLGQAQCRSATVPDQASRSRQRVISSAMAVTAGKFLADLGANYRLSLLQLQPHLHKHACIIVCAKRVAQWVQRAALPPVGAGDRRCESRISALFAEQCAAILLL